MFEKQNAIIRVGIWMDIFGGEMNAFSSSQKEKKKSNERSFF
jgi:hypothetical protein